MASVADTTTWDVVYDDGEEDEGLCPTCVRPFVPYVEGEPADWTDKIDDFIPCKITAVTGEDSYDVQLADGRTLSGVSASNLRRTSNSRSRSMAKGGVVYQVGARVQAQFPEDPEGHFFPGIIHEVHANDRFSIIYDDGDFSDMVFKHMIR